MTIRNINYRGCILDNIDHLPFRKTPPLMYVQNCNDFKLIIFKSGKCRLMGCKQPWQRIIQTIPYRMSNLRIMSATVTFNLEHKINLRKLGDHCYANQIRFCFEPELFPVLRLTTFKPLCVNIFGSGKCVLLGLKHLCYEKVIRKTKQIINISQALENITYNNASQKSTTVIREMGFASSEGGQTATLGLCPTEIKPVSVTTTSKQCQQQQQQFQATDCQKIPK